MKKIFKILVFGIFISAMLFTLNCKYESPSEPELTKIGTMTLESMTVANLNNATKYYYVYKPASYSSGDSFPVVYLLHGFVITRM